METNMTTFAEQYEVFKNNANSAMREDLAETLGVTVEAIEQLGVGFHFGEQAWVFAERDAKGDIIGLSKRRAFNGFKFMAKGSKRGLLYAYNQDHSIGDKKYEAGKFHWVRIADAGVACPICGKPDWCLVSSDDPKNPSAVLCSRVADKSAKEILGSGYLHILDLKRQSPGTNNSVLGQSELPSIIVEGASDVLAAMSLGFTCIGRPSAKGGMEILKEMPLAGREVWIIGDNDAGAGREGVQKTYLNIKKMTETIQCIFPPEGIKDLRQWVQCGLTQESLFEYAGGHGDTSIAVDPDVFSDDTAYIIADRFIKDEYADKNEVALLRNYHEQWVQWTGYKYEPLNRMLLHGKLYRYLDGKRYVKVTAKGIDVVPYKPTRSKVADILDAMSSWCPITVDPPAWMDDEEHVSPNNLISFRNGMLDVSEYIKGNIVLHDPDPRLFTYTVLPYDFNPEAWSNEFEDTYNQWLNEDTDCIRLLAQWFGYNLVHDMSYEKLMVLTGPTRSGKSTATEVLQSMLGPDQYCASSFQALANTYGLSNLVGKLAAILGDAKTPRKSEADTALKNILEIVGGNVITINPKYVTPFDARLSCRFTIAMNGLPEFSDHAQAFVSRSNILEFPNSYEGREDVGLKSRLAKAAANGGMINFALWGLKDLREQGKFIIPDNSADLVGQLREVVAPVLMFVRECCIVDGSEYILRDQMFEAWQHWCTRANLKPKHANWFGRKLKQVCPSIQDFRPTISNRRQRAYKGIGLQPWIYKEFLGRPIK
jgi:putative DNA primase/helicase